MQKKTEMKKEEIPGRGLVDLVFSWSLKDVLNEDLYFFFFFLKKTYPKYHFFPF